MDGIITGPVRYFVAEVPGIGQGTLADVLWYYDGGWWEYYLGRDHRHTFISIKQVARGGCVPNQVETLGPRRLRWAHWLCYERHSHHTSQPSSSAQVTHTTIYHLHVTDNGHSRSSIYWPIFNWTLSHSNIHDMRWYRAVTRDQSICIWICSYLLVYVIMEWNMGINSLWWLQKYTNISIIFYCNILLLIIR